MRRRKQKRDKEIERVRRWIKRGKIRVDVEKKKNGGKKKEDEQVSKEKNRKNVNK